MAKKDKIQKAAKKVASKTADFATDNTKEILVIGGAAILLYLIYKSVSKATNAIDGVTDVFTTDPGAGGGNPNPGSSTNIPSGATITANQAQTIASGLYQAMTGYGTDEEKIYYLLKGKNQKDFAMISQAFGTPAYGAWPGVKRNLSYWLNEELNQGELNELYSLMPAVVI